MVFIRAEPEIDISMVRLLIGWSSMFECPHVPIGFAKKNVCIVL